MTSDRDITIEVWQEICRHLEIRESVHTLARILARRMPLAGLVVRELDSTRRAVHTVGVAVLDGPEPAFVGPVKYGAVQFGRLLRWCRAGQVARTDLARSPKAAPWAPLVGSFEGSALLGPLGGSEGSLGVVVLTARAGALLGSAHQQQLHRLLEPLAVGIQNDHRLRELAALREAAEADRRSLLTRLGREEVVDAVLGADGGLRGVMERVALVANSDLPVLILGETGTGKEVIARAIHHGSPRTSGPFIRVNCGAIPPELIDSQLFGHEKGSFTGAVDRRRGWFERADGGTLFLDEIGDLPLAAQVRLLRILQDGILERVGGEEHIGVDVRIVAATHRDLAAMAREHRFREDLWYRIAVFPILLPPLRDRPDDIPALARHFARRATIRFGLPERMPDDDDLALLAAYPWPGNVRELGTVLDRAAILGTGERLALREALGFGPAAPASAPPPPGSTAAAYLHQPAPSDGHPSNQGTSLDDAVRDHIERALRATRGRIEGPFGAARTLRVNPHTLRSRMRKLGIDCRAFRNLPVS